MKNDIIYNRPDNKLMVRTNGSEIHIICNTESQIQKVIDKMTNDDCIFDGYEEWDEDEDMKWILTFRILDEFELKPDLN